MDFLAAHTSSLDFHDSEVSLAVGLASPHSSQKAIEEEDDDEALDDFFADRGFEFINIPHKESPAPADDSDDYGMYIH